MAAPLVEWRPSIVTRARHVAVNEILVRPTMQDS